MGTAVPNNTNTTNTSNLITNGDSIQIYCKDKYLGYSIKNALFPIYDFFHYIYKEFFLFLDPILKESEDLLG